MFECLTKDEYRVENQDGVLIGVVTKQPAWCQVLQPSTIAVASPSVGVLLRHVQKYMPEPRQGKQSSQRKEKGFNYFDSYEETLDTFLRHPERIRQFQPSDERLVIPSTIGNDVYFDVTGDFLDVDRYLTGEPEHFGVMFMGKPRNLFCTIAINLMASCLIDEQILTQRANRVLRLVDWLENEGVRCQIKAFGTDNCIHLEVGVKEYDEHIDLNALAIVSNTDFFRRIVFRYIEYSQTWRSGYGYPQKFASKQLTLPKQWANDEGFFVISENGNSVEGINKGFDLIEKNLKDKIANEERTFLATF